MRYLGSKASLVQDIFQLVQPRVSHGIFCDPFGGIGTVGAYFKRHGYQVCTGDNLRFAYCFQIAKVELSAIPRFGRLRSFLGLSDADGIRSYVNNLPARPGWITHHYSVERRFFSPENAERIDAAWGAILDWKHRGLVSNREYAFLIASLIESLDRVANTAGTYYAYLKHWYRKAKKDFRFDWVMPTVGEHKCRAHLNDAAATASSHPADILYLDPPHNTRCYHDYYHLPESIALGYRGAVRGMAGIPERPRTVSKFSVRASALEALSRLLHQCTWHLLVLHYSDAGLMTPTQIRSVLWSHGKIEEHELLAKGYSTTATCRTSHRIYLVEHA